ncbi:MAG: hypothetical protein RL294_1144 [Actinomycetota bacterium]
MCLSRVIHSSLCTRSNRLGYIWLVTDEVQGPASYFPSIEKTYGKPVTHWFELLEGKLDKKHMEQVDWLKAEHGIGHGHANALVAHFRNSKGL